MNDHLPGMGGNEAIVPSAPGPLRFVATDADGDDIDLALDDLFGAPDERGPGVADAVLLVGGAITVVAAMAADLPTTITVVGVCALLLGAILPTRALYRRLTRARLDRRRRAQLGDGRLLRIDDADTRALAAAHIALWTSVGSLPADVAGRVRLVAHEAAVEVASLLDGGIPGEPERPYVRERVTMLERLRDAVGGLVADGDPDGARRAAVAARREVEELAGTSSLADADRLLRQLVDDDGP